jgi:hypothetical protein
MINVELSAAARAIAGRLPRGFCEGININAAKFRLDNFAERKQLSLCAPHLE